MNTELPDLRRDRPERLAAAVLPASALVWTAAEIMHWTGRPGVAMTALGAVALSGVTWGALARRGQSSLPLWLAAAGVWVTAADAAGPLRWLHDGAPLTLAWAVIAIAASKAAHRHQAVVDAREWREARADWLARSHEWGLGGSHLLKFQRTRLGELYTVSTKGTRKRASHFLGGHLEEDIAEAEDLPVSRVRVMGHALAGRIRISVRRIDPWADVLLHPLVCDDPEIPLPGARSILDEAIVGQDPETGEPLAVPLCDENGAKRVSVTANSGGGKGVLEDDLFEHVTACDDALAVHLNLSVKGHEDEESWGPACWLTAYGPDQKARAAAVLRIIASVIEWRTKNFKRGRYVPSPEHPAIIIFNDESDSALSALREDINTIVTKGRSHGVGYVHLGQRNTREYADPKSRSQDNVRCTGLVQNANEARHAGSGTGPDMSTYGEGKPGVWKIEILGGGMRLGRTWVFSASPAEHGAEVEAIAQERAFDQPEITGACREYLGAPLEALLETEVFARWARANGGDETGPEDESPSGEPLITAPAAGGADAGTDVAAAVVTGTVLTEDEADPLRRWEMNMDDRERATLASLTAKLGGVRRTLEETAAMPAPREVPPEALAAHTAARWRQVGEEARIPEECLPRLRELLVEGTTFSGVATEFGVTKWIARSWLQNLRNRDAAHVDGVKKAAKWRLGPPPLDGVAAEDGPTEGDAP